ncbi:MAG: glycosyltransferase [Muribaculaceae bacterium]|nr:glycosyltransferase [Muribaculaceae bacterium]
MTLDVLISTHAPEGIQRVEQMGLPHVDGVRYIVSWQRHADTSVPPSLASRSDVEIYRLSQPGLSRNRNNAMDHSTADIMLMADDDLVYTPEGLRSIIIAFEQRPSMLIASFMYAGEDAKKYPASECTLDHLPKGFYQSAIEIAVRRCAATATLRFSPDFGLGSERWPVGEDTIFMLSARHRGITPVFIPLVICTHRGLSTGNRPITDPRMMSGIGACIALEYPYTAPLRIPLKAWREYRARRMSLLPALFHMTAGALRATLSLKKPW